MENIPDDELISAYLDGELSGKDLVRAKQLLASQPDSRQMLDELTALRASLQSLPPHKLGPDFAETVLRRAEREMLQPAAGAGAQAATSGDAGIELARPDAPPLLSMSRWKRSLVWSALATAAAIALMIFNPQDTERNVAVAPGPQGEMGRPGPTLAQRPMPQTAAPAAATTSAPAAPFAADAYSSDGARPMLAGDNAAARDGAVAPMMAPQGAPPSVRGDAERSAEGAPAGNPSFYAGSLGGGRAQTTASSLAADENETLLLVRCDITPDVARSAGFRKMLADQHIEWRELADDAHSPKDAQSTSIKNRFSKGVEVFEKQEARDQRTDGDRQNAVGQRKQGMITKSEGKEIPNQQKDSSKASGESTPKNRTANETTFPAVADSAVSDSAAADATATLAASADAGAPADTAAIYVVAGEAQVNATIAALTENAEYRNFRVTEVSGPLPDEVTAGIAAQTVARSGAVSADGEEKRIPIKRSPAGPQETDASAPPAPAVAPPKSSNVKSLPATAAPGSGRGSLAEGRPEKKDSLRRLRTHPRLASAVEVPLSAAAVEALSRAAGDPSPVADRQPQVPAESNRPKAAGGAAGDKADGKDEATNGAGPGASPANAARSGDKATMAIQPSSRSAKEPSPKESHEGPNADAPPSDVAKESLADPAPPADIMPADATSDTVEPAATAAPKRVLFLFRVVPEVAAPTEP